MSGERNPPFHCPYCGETDLRPQPEGRWYCRSCTRTFSVTYHGTGEPGGTQHGTGDPEGTP